MAQRRHVPLVHREYQVEALEVAVTYLTGTQLAEVDAACARRRLRAHVGRITGVIVVRAGGIDDEIEIRRLLLDEPPEDAFRRRRTADVAHADEQYLHRLNAMT